MRDIKLTQIILLLITGIGLLLLLKSPELAHASASHFLQKNMLGQMNADEYKLMMQAYADSYRNIGTITFSVGGFFTIRTFLTPVSGTNTSIQEHV